MTIDFCKYGHGPSPKRYASRDCKECNRLKTKRKQRERKKYLVTMLGGQCIICGYNKSAGAMHFDHLDPATKSFSISSRMGAPLDVLVAEVKKCRLLCANCHAEYTWSELW